MLIDIVLEYIRKNGLSKAAFEKKAKISNAYLANIKKTKSEIQPKILEKMFTAYPDLKAEIEKNIKPKRNQTPLDGTLQSYVIGGVEVFLTDAQIFDIKNREKDKEIIQLQKDLIEMQKTQILALESRISTLKNEIAKEN